MRQSAFILRIAGICLIGLIFVAPFVLTRHYDLDDDIDIPGKTDHLPQLHILDITAHVDADDVLQQLLLISMYRVVIAQCGPALSDGGTERYGLITVTKLRLVVLIDILLFTGFVGSFHLRLT